MMDKAYNHSNYPDVFKKKQNLEKSKNLKNPLLSHKEGEEHHLSMKAYKKTPPRCDLSNYTFFGEITPDPFRPLQKLEDENVRLWINYQRMRLNEHLEDDRLIDLENSLREYTLEPKLPYSLNRNKYGIYLTKQSSNKIVYWKSYSFEWGGEPSSFIILHNSRTRQKDIILNELDYYYMGSQVDFDSIMIDYNLTFAYCDLKGQNGQIIKSYIINLKTKAVIDETDKNNRVLFEAWHPSCLGFYYKKNENIGTKEKPKRINSLFFHSIGDDWENDLIVFRDVDTQNVKTRVHSWFNYQQISDPVTLLFKVSYISSFTNIQEQFLINPDNPCDLIRVPLWRHFQSSYDPYILSIYDGNIVAVISKNFNRRDIVLLPLWSSDWNESKPILKNLEISDLYDIQFYKGKIITIENQELQKVLNIFSIKGELLFTYKPDIPSTIIFQSFAEEDSLIIYISHYLSKARQAIVDLVNFTILDLPSNISPFEDLLVSIKYSISNDGTRIPLTLIHRKDIKLNGSNPTILYGYGGFGYCHTPQYDKMLLWWVQRGGVYAIAHIRGNGGWENNWAEMGSRRNKQNTFDDFIASAEFLIDQGYTRSKKLAAIGCSNGGMTVNACMQKRPDLFGAIVSQAPITDMLNFSMENFSNDKTLWLYDYGTPYLPEDYEILMSYSPLHNISSNTHYPPILVMALKEDERAHAGNALKYVATMQDINGKSDIFLFTKDKGFHTELFIDDNSPDYKAYAVMYQFILKSFDAL